MSESTPGTNQNFSFDTLIDNVKKYADTYETALKSLEQSATSGTDTDVDGNETTTPGSVNITDATVATTRVQITQSLTEMASGIAKNAATHTKELGRKISS
ncbi:MAG: hypothetical protein ACO3K7_00625 [Candidatus Marinamargulisbacteria bacterium]